MRKRALLINPPTGLYIREDRCQAPLKGMAATSARSPLDLAYMAATLEAKGVECRIRDYPVQGGSWDELRRDLRAFRPEMLIVSVTSFTINDDLIACRIAREELEAAVLTVAKGAHVAVKAREVVAGEPSLDVAIRGEYEFIAAGLAVEADPGRVRGITFRDPASGEIVTTEDRPFVEDLDSIPFPARHLLDNSLYLRPDTGDPQATVQTSRGCPGECIYCLAPVVYGSRIRVRSPGNVVAELAECVERHGIRDFFFRADTFTWNRKWVLDLCRAIVARAMRIRWVCNSRVDTIDAGRLAAMKAAGCHGIAFGIESGSQEILDRMRKGITLEKSRAAVKLCREHGMSTLLYFIMGMPWETADDVRKSVDFALELKGDFVEFHLAIPFPGTELYEIARRDGLLTGDSLHGYDYARSPLRTYSLTARELLKLRREAFIKAYLTPRAMLRVARAVLRSAHSPRKLMRTLRFGTAKLASLVLSRQESR